MLPAEIRRQMMPSKPDRPLTSNASNAGEYKLVRRAPPSNQGLVDWLLACPQKGYFVSVASESTAVL